jgi:hypothetical protein
MDQLSSNGLLSVAGVVSRILQGANNETCGVLLDNGNVVLFPPHFVQLTASHISAGQALAARGYGVATGRGLVIDAQAIGASLDEV